MLTPKRARATRKVQRALLLWLVALLVPSLCQPAHAAPPERRRDVEDSAADEDSFAQHRKRISATVGNTYSDGESYLLVGVGFGYYFLHGLQLGIDSDLWLLGSPTIWNVSPELRYVLQTEGHVHPYVGTFYRHAFVFDLPDQDSIGGRLGFYARTGRGAFIAAGAVYERWLSCDEDTFRSCDNLYPELSFALTF